METGRREQLDRFASGPRLAAPWDEAFRAYRPKVGAEFSDNTSDLSIES
jgi:hypothetical protein